MGRDKVRKREQEIILPHYALILFYRKINFEYLEQEHFFNFSLTMHSSIYLRRHSNISARIVLKEVTAAFPTYKGMG
jgi:hypothetical protein